MVDVAIIIVSWNVRDKLRACLHSIAQSSPEISRAVMVVDNASHDNSVEMVRSEFPEVMVIANSENVGTSKAVNQALQKVDARFVLWLNPDMQLFEDTLRVSVAEMEQHKKIGVLGVHLVNEQGETVPQVRKLPTWFDQGMILSKIAKFFPNVLNEYLCVDFDYTHAQAVPSIRGSYFFMRREALQKVGNFDEQFFVWFEEVDMCKRLLDAGFTVWYTPRTKAIDLVGQSFAQVGTLKKQKMFVTSMMKYFKKHGIFG